MPDLLRIEAKYRAAGLTFIGINAGESPERIAAFRKQYNVPYPILMDKDSSVFDRIGTGHLPTHLFYNTTRYLTCLGIEGFTAKDVDNEIAVALGV